MRFYPHPKIKKSTATKASEQPKTLDQQSDAVEPLKDASVYKQEVSQYLATTDVKYVEIEKKIQRGALKNGMKYALFPTTTRDDKTYATLFADSWYSTIIDE